MFKKWRRQTKPRINLFGFGHSDALTKANLPQNLKIIGGGSTGGAFNYCGELTELIIPETLTSVEFAAKDSQSDEIRRVKEGEKPRGWWEAQGPINAFQGCTKLPLKIRQQLKDMGYNGEI